MLIGISFAAPLHLSLSHSRFAVLFVVYHHSRKVSAYFVQATGSPAGERALRRPRHVIEGLLGLVLCPWRALGAKKWRRVLLAHLQ